MYFCFIALTFPFTYFLEISVYNFSMFIYVMNNNSLLIFIIVFAVFLLFCVLSNETNHKRSVVTLLLTFFIHSTTNFYSLFLFFRIKEQVCTSIYFLSKFSLYLTYFVIYPMKPNIYCNEQSAELFCL